MNDDAGGRTDAARRAAALFAVALGFVAPCGAEEPQEPKPLVVALQGDADARTIADAIARAPKGGLVLVRPGVYRESLVIDRAVRIRADAGDASTVVLEGTKGPALKVSTKGVVVTGMSLRVRKAPGMTVREAVATEVGASAELNACVVSTDDGCAVAARGGSELRLFGCRIDGAPGDGVAATEVASVVLDRTTIAGCKRSGIALQDRASARGKEVVVTGCTGDSITALARTTLSLEVATLKDGGARGIAAVGPSTKVRLTNVRIQGCGGNGVALEAGATVEAQDLDVSDVRGMAVRVDGAGPRVVLRSCRVHKALAGVILKERDALVEKCDLSGCEKNGIEIGGTCAVTIFDSKVHEQKTGGDIVLHDDCKVSIEDCECWGTPGPGIWVGKKAQIEVHGGSVHDGGQDGVYVCDLGFLNLTGTEIRGNKGAGIRIDAGIVFARDCKITKNIGTGVVVKMLGSGDFLDCDVTGNRGGAWSIADHAMVTRTGSKPAK